MVSGRDLALVTGIMFISGAVLVGAAGVALPGSNTVKDVITQPKVNKDTKYVIESCMDYTGEVEQLPDPNSQLLVENSFKYRTYKDKGIQFSAVELPLSLAGVKDTRIDYVIRNSEGRVVGSGSDYSGTVGLDEQKSSCFKTGELSSGDYRVTYRLSGTGFGLFGETGEKSDKVTETVSVPKLPLGEY